MRAKRAAGLRSSADFDPCAIDEPAAGASRDDMDRDAFTALLADLAAVRYERVHDLATLVRAFEGLDRMEFGLVQHFLNGGTMSSYARANGLSKQTAHARCKALFRRRPVFRSIANGLLGKLKGGRMAAGTQQTLFDFGNAADAAESAGVA